MNKLNWVFLRDSFGLNVSFPRWGGEGQVYGICLKYRFLKECSFFIYGFYGNIIVSKLAYHIYMSSQFYFFVFFTQITSPRVRYHSFSDLFMYQMYQKKFSSTCKTHFTCRFRTDTSVCIFDLQISLSCFASLTIIYWIDMNTFCYSGRHWNHFWN